MRAVALRRPSGLLGQDQDKNLWQIQSDAPIIDIDANFLESWLWAKHPALENSIFEAFDNTTMA